MFGLRLIIAPQFLHKGLFLLRLVFSPKSFEPVANGSKGHSQTGSDLSDAKTFFENIL